jgi:hypothetical protein
MSKTGMTFPSNYENSPMGRISGSFMNNEIIKDKEVMVGQPNPLYEGERQRQMARIQNNRNRDALLMKGGWYSTAPKPQPSGSFNSPLNLNGNTGYGKTLSGGGLLRTQQVQNYYDKILQERKNQLEALQEAQETGQSLEPRPVVETESEIENDLSRVSAILSNIVLSFYNGDYDKMKPSDISALYTALLKNGLNFPSFELEKFYNTINEMVETIKTLSFRQQNEPAYKSIIFLLPRGVAINLVKINVLIKVLLGVKNLNIQDNKQSSRVINQYSRRIINSNSLQSLARLSEEIDSKLSPKVPQLETTDLDDNARSILDRILSKQAVARSLQARNIGDIGVKNRMAEIQTELDELDDIVEDLTPAQKRRKTQLIKQLTDIQKTDEFVDFNKLSREFAFKPRSQRKLRQVERRMGAVEKGSKADLRRKIRELEQIPDDEMTQQNRRLLDRFRRRLSRLEGEEEEEPDLPPLTDLFGEGKRKKLHRLF